LEFHSVEGGTLQLHQSVSMLTEPPIWEANEVA